MKKMSAVGVVLVLFMVASCASTGNFAVYRSNLQDGYTDLVGRQYQAAIQKLVVAGQMDTTKAMPLALAGQAAYQMGNYAQATQYLAQAETRVKGPDAAYVIIKGYQSLIAFRENKREEGMTALGEYVRVYGQSKLADKSLIPVQAMYKSGNIVVPQLEREINEGMAFYEMKLQQWGWDVATG
ncbi:MAG: hypothetical protein H6Q55_1847 [Deltaproteobacteria bacterium]|jgi:tetratricopeptide (TPR) repeat protein|nr:hypothetical protein [Deltaproteobacteria bacterium]